jgi:hypothetical protein
MATKPKLAIPKESFNELITSLNSSFSGFDHPEQPMLQILAYRASSVTWTGHWDDMLNARERQEPLALLNDSFFGNAQSALKDVLPCLIMLQPQ